MTKSETARVTFSAGGGLYDRAAHLRDMSADLLRHRWAALLPMHRGRVLIDIEGEGPSLGWVPPLDDYIGLADEPPVFLGLAGQTPCFTADFSNLPEMEVERHFCEGARFEDLRAVAGELPAQGAALAATAKALVGWHATHRFCARCGSPSDPDNGGWRRRCPACGAQHFPRTDPVVIMLIVRDDHVLVGRQPVWPEGLYSLLAGFVEPGETIEDAVRRETKEEAGIDVGTVAYHGCQPWPFPMSLMIGCVGIGLNEEITLDPEELEDAQWISRAKMEVILAGKHPRIRSPRKDAIARAILLDWVSGTLALP